MGKRILGLFYEKKNEPFLKFNVLDRKKENKGEKKI